MQAGQYIPAPCPVQSQCRISIRCCLPSCPGMPGRGAPDMSDMSHRVQRAWPVRVARARLALLFLARLKSGSEAVEGNRQLNPVTRSILEDERYRGFAGLERLDLFGLEYKIGEATLLAA